MTCQVFYPSFVSPLPSFLSSLLRPFSFLPPHLYSSSPLLSFSPLSSLPPPLIFSFFSPLLFYCLSSPPSLPLLPLPYPLSRLLLTLGKTSTKHLASGFQEQVTGAQAEVQFPSFLGKHGLALSWDWRNLGEFSSTVPLSVRQDAGHTLKCAVKVCGVG